MSYRRELYNSCLLLWHGIGSSPSGRDLFMIPVLISNEEKRFLLEVGEEIAFLKTVNKLDHAELIVQILSEEGETSSKIEGEILDRESLQSSIKRHFGLQHKACPVGKRESAMAKLLYEAYESFDQPLTHEMMWKWHAVLFEGTSHLESIGIYRNHSEPMQIVSQRYINPKIFFEAPPSDRVLDEMTRFIDWFNSTGSEPILGRAAIAHVYFESIHPFEDGNGRIGRALVEKILSQGIGRPSLIAVSKILEKRKKEYYSSLERCNTTLEIGNWVIFFAGVILQAKEDSMRYIAFLIQKAKVLSSMAGVINLRQEKVLLRMFECGPGGFVGGLSAEKYIAITKTSRATATRDLTELVVLGVLVRTGELKHTRYWLYRT